MGQVVTALESVDEFDYFSRAIKSVNQEYVQHLIAYGLNTPTLQKYLKIII
jgi:hypothetical protein